jgi:hypothetical protein
MVSREQEVIDCKEALQVVGSEIAEAAKKMDLARKVRKCYNSHG